MPHWVVQQRVIPRKRQQIATRKARTLYDTLISSGFVYIEQPLPEVARRQKDYRAPIPDALKELEGLLGSRGHNLGTVLWTDSQRDTPHTVFDNRLSLAGMSSARISIDNVDMYDVDEAVLEEACYKRHAAYTIDAYEPYAWGYLRRTNRAVQCLVIKPDGNTQIHGVLYGYETTEYGHWLHSDEVPFKEAREVQEGALLEQPAEFELDCTIVVPTPIVTEADKLVASDIPEDFVAAMRRVSHRDYPDFCEEGTIGIYDASVTGISYTHEFFSRQYISV
ncbi:hypothetical protein [Sinomonas sp. P10A9]|uniref:Uncharacterized protein n=1 Tax=Sinomonas puerhi TaxID=3238584 RepID=A0AB39KYE4_9MICC